MSRSRILASFSSSRQMMMAWKVSGLSQRPAIIASRPASMRLAMAISPSRDRSSTWPISRRYMRTGSSVRSAGVLAASTLISAVSVDSPSASASTLAVRFSVSSSDSTTLMPISLSIAMMSSICSGLVSSEGRTALSSSRVTKPRALASLIIRFTAASERSRIGESELSPAASGASLSEPSACGSWSSGAGARTWARAMKKSLEFRRGPRHSNIVIRGQS